ncbi:MAG: cytochrome c peroxidase [Emcibacteraceae bacterium]|nr:cytochrome c peroxidase [Emcibacteraceae bacterium]
MRYRDFAIFISLLVATVSIVYFLGLPRADKNAEYLLSKVIKAQDLKPLETRIPRYGEVFLLGQALFFDPVLSGSREVACSTCHLLDVGATDGQALSIGVGGDGLGAKRAFISDNVINLQTRNALDLFNRDHNHVRSLFWDGRVEAVGHSSGAFKSELGDLLPDTMNNALAVQALFPIARVDEMLGEANEASSPSLPEIHSNKPNELAVAAEGKLGPERIRDVLNALMERLLSRKTEPEEWQLTYRQLFSNAFPEKTLDAFDFSDLGNAISRYEEVTFATRNTPWDNYLKGDVNAISNKAKVGATLFYGKGQCAVCHNGPLFSDFNFYSLGISQDSVRTVLPNGDKGRHDSTQEAKDAFKFRTSPLRNVTLTAPYFHNGSASTLEVAIMQHLNANEHAEQYNLDGSFKMEDAEINAISPLLMQMPELSSREILAIIDFLGALEDKPADDWANKSIPDSVPSGLLIQATTKPLHE